MSNRKLSKQQSLECSMFLYKSSRPFLPVKNSAVQAISLWKVMCESNGTNRLTAVERRYVMEFRHIVRRIREKEKDIAAAAPRVKLIP